MQKAPKGFNVTELGAVAWWVNNTPFTRHCNETATGTNARLCEAAYMELVIGIEADTRVHIGGIMVDLATKATKLAEMLRYLVTNIGLYINDDANKINFKKSFSPRLVRCTRDIPGIRLPGVGRRPLWSSLRDTEKLIAANLHVASGVRGTARPSENPAIKGAWRTCGVETLCLRCPRG